MIYSYKSASSACRNHLKYKALRSQNFERRIFDHCKEIAAANSGSIGKAIDEARAKIHLSKSGSDYYCYPKGALLFLDMLHAHIDDRFDMVVVQGIDDRFALLAVFD